MPAMHPAPTPQPDNPWLRIEKRIAELLDGGPAPTDVEDVRLAESDASPVDVEVVVNYRAILLDIDP